jgi:hypothetical protein
VPREAQPILAGHVDVEDREVDQLRGHDRARRDRVFGADGRVTVVGEVLLQRLADAGLVVDNQYCCFRAHGRCQLHRASAAPEAKSKVTSAPTERMMGAMRAIAASPLFTLFSRHAKAGAQD